MKRKPTVDRKRFTLFGKFLDDALTLANMSQSELARQAGLRSSSYLAKVMKGQRSADRPVLLKWCQILECPEWLEERILNAAGYVSDRQRKAVEAEEVVEETHKTVMEEAAKRAKQN